MSEKTLLEPLDLPELEGVPARPTRQRVLVGLLLGLGIPTAMLVGFWHQLPQIADSFTRISPWLLLAAGLASLLVCVLRTYVWGQMVSSAGTEVCPRTLHAVSGPTLLVGQVVPHWLSSWLRMAGMRRVAEQRPSWKALMVSELALALAEGGLGCLLLLGCAVALGMPLVWTAGAAAIIVVGALASLTLLHYRPGPGLAPLRALWSPQRRRGMMFSLVAVIWILQPLRYWLMLEGVGLHPTPMQAAAIFVVAGLAGALPVGAPAAMIAVCALFFPTQATKAAAAGIAVAGTLMIACVIYSCWGAFWLAQRKRAARLQRRELARASLS